MILHSYSFSLLLPRNALPPDDFLCLSCLLAITSSPLCWAGNHVLYEKEVFIGQYVEPLACAQRGQDQQQRKRQGTRASLPYDVGRQVLAHGAAGSSEVALLPADRCGDIARTAAAERRRLIMAQKAFGVALDTELTRKEKASYLFACSKAVYPSTVIRPDDAPGRAVASWNVSSPCDVEVIHLQALLDAKSQAKGVSHTIRDRGILDVARVKGGVVDVWKSFGSVTQAQAIVPELFGPDAEPAPVKQRNCLIAIRCFCSPTGQGCDVYVRRLMA